MSVADFLLNLSQQFETGSITLQPAACLNARFRTAGCSHCADVCPAEAAITVVNGRPALDRDACLHCGLCLHRCPTGAFTRPDGFSRKLTRTAATVSAGPVELVCPQQPNPALGAVPHAIQTQRCLAAVSAATLLELTAGGKDIWLDDRYCAGCPLGTVRPEMVQTAAEANGWAALLADSGTVRLRSEQPELPAAPRPVLDATRPSLSRRGLFGVFKPPAAPAADTLTEAAKLINPGRSIAPSNRLPQTLPVERAAILNILAHQTPATPEAPPRPGAQLPLVDVQIDPARCTACGLCAKFCPTGALKFLSDDRTFTLAFQPDSCLGQLCNICRSACPEQAVTTSPAKAASGKRPLAAGELTLCTRCQTPIARGPELSPLCFACRPRENSADLLASLSK